MIKLLPIGVAALRRLRRQPLIAGTHHVLSDFNWLLDYFLKKYLLLRQEEKSFKNICLGLKKYLNCF